MILKIRFGKWKLTFALAQVYDVVGVNSTLPDGNHILMWDFDDVDREYVIAALDIIQVMEDLPLIRILRTSKPNNYIAYCLCRVSWADAIRIVASTKYVDKNFFKWAVFRGYFTLRVSPKDSSTPKLVYRLFSNVKETVKIEELCSFTKYETLKHNSLGGYYKLALSGRQH